MVSTGVPLGVGLTDGLGFADGLTDGLEEAPGDGDGDVAALALGLGTVDGKGDGDGDALTGVVGPVVGADVASPVVGSGVDAPDGWSGCVQAPTSAPTQTAVTTVQPTRFSKGPAMAHASTWDQRW